MKECGKNPAPLNNHKLSHTVEMMSIHFEAEKASGQAFSRCVDKPKATGLRWVNTGLKGKRQLDRQPATDTAPALIEYSHISVVRRAKKLLNDVNLRIDQGEHVAILGPNGAGKSTLIRTITREIYPVADANHSCLRILGDEQWDVFELRSRLGIVNAELPRRGLRELSCFDFVLSAFFASLGIWPGQEISEGMKQKVREVLDFLEIGKLARNDIEQISTGEARKIMIGRALVHDPPALLLDEPTASLDPGATHEVRSILRKLARKGKSLVMVTQNLADILPEIERLIMLKDGEIFRDGKKRELLTEPTLSELFGVELSLLRRDGYYCCF
jgi:iron complex transport system ATP-binding protein